jgi:biopolymer transport protein ExbD
MAEQNEDIWNQATPKGKKRSKSRRDDAGGALNINSMMDIMVIILVFLLKSYGDEPLKVQKEDLKAPSSMAELQPKDMTTITITQKAILVDDKKAVDVKRGQIDKSQKKGGENALMIQPLFEELNASVKQKKREKELLKQKYEPTATIIADQAIPYRLVTEVMYTAGQAELSQFKIAVIKKQRTSFGGN